MPRWTTNPLRRDHPDAVRYIVSFIVTCIYHYYGMNRLNIPSSNPLIRFSVNRLSIHRSGNASSSCCCCCTCAGDGPKFIEPCATESFRRAGCLQSPGSVWFPTVHPGFGRSCPPAGIPKRFVTVSNTRNVHFAFNQRSLIPRRYARHVWI